MNGKYWDPTGTWAPKPISDRNPIPEPLIEPPPEERFSDLGLYLINLKGRCTLHELIAFLTFLGVAYLVCRSF